MFLVKFTIDGEERFLSKNSNGFTANRDEAYLCKTEHDANLTIKDIKLIYGYVGEIESL